MKWTTPFVIGLVSGLAGSAAPYFIMSGNNVAEVHVLKQPMLVSSNTAAKVMHLLPVGTTLYFDKSYSEGVTRYKVFVNVDRMPLILRELVDPNEIDPLEALAFDKPALVQALRN